MLMGPLIIIGAIVGTLLAALGHPGIYRGIFGGRARSDDHRPEGF